VLELGMNKEIVSIKEYRHLLKDEASSDEQILKRLAYLEAFCRNIIRIEVEAYLKNQNDFT
jgi:hypothetical protein